jgi:carboxylesterase
MAARLMAALAAIGVLSALLFWVAMRRRATMRRLEALDTARRPRDADGVVLGAAPIHLPGSGDRAVLLIHGFNDTPQSMAYLASRLQAAGYAVHVPRLPGHGCSLREMARQAEVEGWRRAIREAYDTMARTHRDVFLCGQSMGGALAVLEAVDRGTVRAMALLAPYLAMPRALQRRLQLAVLVEPLVTYHVSAGGERSIHDPEARRAALGPGIVTAGTLRALQAVAAAGAAVLPRLMTPVLYVQSRQDNRVSEATAISSFAAIGSHDKQQRWLDGSGHILSADYERDAVADAVIAWFDRVGAT